ncbi:MAG: SpoIIE family protein phosphatase [Lachnospiraceae bacterium]|nr:SpoIIE family protein phosphatase [Lachnospiraceae bacterium]
MKKRPRLSILVRIALLFLTAIIISTILTALISSTIMVTDAARQNIRLAGAVATAAKTALGSKEAVYRLHEDEQYRDQIRKTFRFICSKTGARYLYMYTVDENEYRHYLISAARDDEDDMRMDEVYGYGKVQKLPLYKSEKNVLEGDADEDYVFVDNSYGHVCMYTVPVTDYGEVIALIGVDYPIEDIADIIKEKFRLILKLEALVISLAFIIALFLIRRSVIRPIKGLSERMRRFASDRQYSKQDKRSAARFEDEMTDIEKSFEEMALDISGYIEDIESLTREKLQTATQLEVARKIQCGIVPFEYAVSGNGYEAFGRELTAKEVGGDFYDIFAPGEEKICIVIGDVSGKGISAALFMVMIKTALKEKIKAGNSLSDAFTAVNRDICLSNPECMFATVFALIIDTKTGEAVYINAGHNPPLMLGRDPSFLKAESGTVMGVFDDIVLKEETYEFHDGEGMLIFTDGITEAINCDKIQYGDDRLKETVRIHYDENGLSYHPDMLVNSIIDSVKEYAGDLEQFDDITCAAVVFRRDDKDQGGRI